MKGIELDRSRRFGDVFVGLTLWHALRLEEPLEERIPVGREDVAWSTFAAAIVICRLCTPSSELHLDEVLYRLAALGDLLGVPDDKVNDDRLYRALGKLSPHQDAIEKHLRARLGEMFDLEYDLLIYNATSTYFEGLADRNPQAQRGHSRDHRSDCK